MSTPTPWGAPYGGPPPVPSAPPNIPAGDLRPRRIWYLVAALLGLVLAGVGVALVVVTVKDTLNSVDTDRSFASGQSRTFSFVQGKTKAIYVSQSGKGRVVCRIPGMPSGSVTQPDSTFRITLGSRTWDRVLEVKPGSSGDYTLTCTSEFPSAEFALGDKPQVGSMVGGIVAAVGCFLAAAASTVAICVVTAVRRSRHRRRLAAPLGPPPYGAAPWPTYGPPR
ncbi:serine/arginine repetitive matrix protein 2 [Streptomyces sp. NPDC048665]|uniref:serine/arginine repetitive matrix protein 2 n=1 Tax=Streptomyces sp. NPDC048665 TaxID=3155490 RepID=UPI0034295CF3